MLADDLIWSTRLIAQLRGAGALPVHVRDAAAFARALATADGAVVDLTARGYDGLEALAAARDARVPVIAVGQHDDAPARRAARAAGAVRVHAYRTLFERGPAELAAWLGTLGPAPAPRTVAEPSEEER